jgi:hypothetical protein
MSPLTADTRVQSTITVRVKDVYGKTNIYPACAASHIFASIAGTNTLTPDTIKRIKTLGYQVNVEQQKVEI